MYVSMCLYMYTHIHIHIHIYIHIYEYKRDLLCVHVKNTVKTNFAAFSLSSEEQKKPQTSAQAANVEPDKL